jgi:NifU-like domain
MDLEASLQQHLEEMENGQVANVRALSFAIPSRASMDDWMKKWNNLALDAGGMALNPLDYLVEEDEDEDEDWDPEMLAAASAAAADIVSPFDPSSANTSIKAAGNEELPMTLENVNKVLDEVRPYLVADGGNVAVKRVEPERGAVYLQLEGACGKHG